MQTPFATAASFAAEFSNICSCAYPDPSAAYQGGAADYQMRTNAINAMEALVGRVSPAIAMEAFLGMTYSAAYAETTKVASLYQLNKLAVQGLVAVPVYPILTSLSEVPSAFFPTQPPTTSALTKPVMTGLSNLVVTAAVLTWPEGCPELLPRMCPEDLQKRPALMMVLEQFCAILIGDTGSNNLGGGGGGGGGPDRSAGSNSAGPVSAASLFDNQRLDRRRVIRRTLVDAAPTIGSRVVQATGALYQLAEAHLRQNAPAGTTLTQVSPELETQLQRCLSILQWVVGCIPDTKVWWSQLYIPDCVMYFMASTISPTLLLSACNFYAGLCEVRCFSEASVYVASRNPNAPGGGGGGANGTAAVTTTNPAAAAAEVDTTAIQFHTRVIEVAAMTFTVDPSKSEALRILWEAFMTLPMGTLKLLGAPFMELIRRTLIREGPTAATIPPSLLFGSFALEIFGKFIKLVPVIPATCADPWNISAVMSLADGQLVMVPLKLPSALIPPVVTAAATPADNNNALIQVLLTSVSASPVVLIQKLQQLAKKFVYNPIQNDRRGPFYQGPCAMLSAMEFGASTEDYMQVFSSVRTSVVAVVKWLAIRCPYAVSMAVNQLQQHLILPNAQENRSPFGHIQQQTETFVQWESIVFIIESINSVLKWLPLKDVFSQSMAEAAQAAMRNASPQASPDTAIVNYSPAAISAMLKHLSQSVPTDATLIPLFLNLHASYWSLSDGSHWLTTAKMLLQVAQTEGIRLKQHGGGAGGVQVDYNDLDLVAARKRGLSLLIRAANEHAAELAPYVSNILDYCQSMILQSRVLPSETVFLFEAMVSLCNAAAYIPIDGSVAPEVIQQRINAAAHVREAQLERILGSRFEGLKKLLDEDVCSSPSQFAKLFISGTDIDRKKRLELKDSLIILTAAFRRCCAGAVNPSVARRQGGLGATVMMTAAASGASTTSTPQQQQAHVTPSISVYMQQQAMFFLTKLGSAVQCLMMLPAVIPPTHAAIFAFDDQEREALQQQGQRRGPVGEQERASPLYQARTALTWIRDGLFRSLSSALFLLNSIPQYAATLLSLVENIPVCCQQPMATIQGLYEHCLFPAAIQFPPMAVRLIPLAGAYIQQKATLATAPSTVGASGAAGGVTRARREMETKDEIATTRLLSYFVKDVFQMIKAVLSPQVVAAAAASLNVATAQEGSTIGGSNGMEVWSHTPRVVFPDRLSSLTQSTIEGFASAVLNFVGVVLLTGLEFATVSRDALSIFKHEIPAQHGPSHNGGQNMDSRVSNESMQMATWIIMAAVTKEGSRVSLKDQGDALSSVGDWFIAAYPQSKTALLNAGVTMDAVGRLETDLMTIQRGDLKRRRFVKCVVEESRKDILQRWGAGV